MAGMDASTIYQYLSTILRVPFAHTQTYRMPVGAGHRVGKVPHPLFHYWRAGESSAAGSHVNRRCWQEFMGSMDKETSFKLLDAFVEAGFNFIDTANNYQDEAMDGGKKEQDLMVLQASWKLRLVELN